MKKPLGFLQGKDGNYSNSRLIADIEMGFALLLIIAFVAIRIMYPLINLMDLATAIVVVYGGISATAKVFLYGQKRTENKDNIIPTPTEEITN